MTPEAQQEKLTPIRVLVVTTSFPLRKEMVSGVFVERLADALGRETNVETEVLAPDSVLSSDESIDKPYQLTTFRYAPRRWQRLAHQPGGIPVALKNQPPLWLLVPLFLSALLLTSYRRGEEKTVIHANWAITGMIAGWAGRLRGIPVCTTIRGADVDSLGTSTLKRWIARRMLANSRCVAAVSKSMAADLKQHFPEHAHKIAHIPNGISEKLLKLPLPNPAERLKLIIVGSLIHRKAVHIALDALREHRSHMTLTIVGDGPERKKLEELVSQYGLDHQVSFLGTQTPDRVESLLAEHDILLLTSLSEGRPNVVLEAMAAGRVVVASRLPGVAELVHDGASGILFPAGDSKALSTALRTLANDPASIRKLAAAGRQVIVDHRLTWEGSAAQYLELYRDAQGAQ